MSRKGKRTAGCVVRKKGDYLLITPGGNPSSNGDVTDGYAELIPNSKLPACRENLPGTTRSLGPLDDMSDYIKTWKTKYVAIQGNIALHAHDTLRAAQEEGKKVWRVGTFDVYRCESGYGPSMIASNW